MSKKDQKDLAHVMHRMQNGVRFTIAPFGELNFEMASDILISFY